MIGENRVRDHLNISFRHVAADTVVGRSVPLTHTQRNQTAALGMAGHAFLAEVGGHFLASRLHMRIMTAQAT